jgi:filamentous hemagglutinin family protein
MGITSKIFGEKKTGLTEGYIDLEKYTESKTDEAPTGNMNIRIGEIQRYEDLKGFTDYVYGGNVLILDFTPIAEEEVILKRITNELKKMASDTNGDIAGIGNNMMIISPSGVKIDRRKLRGKYS